jgi:hypothetical protein
MHMIRIDRGLPGRDDKAAPGKRVVPVPEARSARPARLRIQRNGTANLFICSPHWRDGGMSK